MNEPERKSRACANLSMFKTLIRSALGIVGYELRKKDERGFCASYLSMLYQPNTVIDVGVGNGTHELYKAYPTARFILIEPLVEFKHAIEKISDKYNCKVYYKALGSQAGDMEMEINTFDPILSSFKSRVNKTEVCEKRIIEISTLNQIYKDNKDIKLPVLLKIDTEGNELEVLEGAKELLPIIDAVIIEVSISKRFSNSYNFEDIIIFMKENGFRVFDFLTICYERYKPGANLTDIFFKRL